MRVLNNNKGFSLIEALLAGLIFVLSVAGVFATMGYVQKPVINNKTALEAAVFGREVLQGLRSQVDANEFWKARGGGQPGTGGNLGIGTVHPVPASMIPNSLVSASYVVECVPPTESPCLGPRKVNLTINWRDVR